MRCERRLHRLLAAMLAAVLIGFVLLFVYLDHRASDVWMEGSVALAMEVVVTTGLISIGSAEVVVAFQFEKRHKREIMSYLVLSALSIACALYLSMTESSSLRTIALVVSPHALLFGAAQIRASQHMGHHPTQKRALQVCGLSEILMGFGLIAVSRVSDSAAAGFLGYVAAVTAFQLIGFLMYKRVPRERPTNKRPSLSAT